MYEIIKILSDKIASLLGLIVLSPVLLTLAIIIRLRMGAPVLFRQMRPGKNGCPFVIYKLRTMTGQPGDESGESADEVRLTRLGRAIRACSLDELPQLWNVLKGDLSLIGPRPLLMEYLPLYNPEQARRHDVKPGITGWAQVNGRNAVTWDERFKLDLWYINHRSTALDLKIAILSILRIFQRRGVSSQGQATMGKFTG